ncbi:hypothetical protein V8J82_23240 [Gymnodinialimonas sp. 2305UL16-5]|uniref:hypothetical protein n=1 Tax=Gymnodinialimonas mytili TaxID=3126503 RepID=UPI00309AA802
MNDEAEATESSVEREIAAPPKDYVSRIMSAIALCVSVLAGSAQAWDVFVQGPRERQQSVALRLDVLFSDYGDCLTEQSAAAMSGDPAQQFAVTSRCNLVRTNLISELREAGEVVIDLVDMSDLIHGAWALTEVEEFELSNAYSERAIEEAPTAHDELTARAVKARNDFFSSAGQDHASYRSLLDDLEQSDSGWNYSVFASAAANYVGAMAQLALCEEVSEAVPEMQGRFDALRASPTDRAQFARMLMHSAANGECS